MHQLTCNGVLEGIRICRKGYPNRIIYNDFRTRYVILAPKESVAAMKKVKRPVTEEKKNIAATHAVMDKINLVGDKFQYGHTKIFFRAGILGLMEEIRDDCINNLVAMMQGTIRAYYARRIYNRLWKHKMGLLVAQRTIRGYMIGKTWLWWSLWLALKPGLKSGHFEEFKQQLAEKIQFAQDHLDEVIAQRQVSEKKHAQLTSEVDEIKVSLAGGTNAKEDLLSKIAKLEDIKGGLQKEINALNTKINNENEQIEGLQEALKKTEASQGSLGREMRECESRLAQVQDEKADKDAQIKQMKEECLHQGQTALALSHLPAEGSLAGLRLLQRLLKVLDLLVFIVDLCIQGVDLLLKATLDIFKFGYFAQKILFGIGATSKGDLYLIHF